MQKDNYSLYILKLLRKNFTKMLENCSVKELNEVPDGFNNNIIWNFCHAMVISNIHIYRNSGLSIPLEESLVNNFIYGKKPEKSLTAEKIEMIKLLAPSNLETIIKDYNKQVFKEYYPYVTGFGANLKSVEDAFQCSVLHESLHYGYAMAIKRRITK